MLPIILLLGPAGCGKGTFAKRIISSYRLFHFSVGDWLRSQSKAPILGVSDDRINDYVSLSFQIPTAWLTQSYGENWMENAPPALILYVCSKLNISTPSSMWIRSMNALRLECETTSTFNASWPGAVELTTRRPSRDGWRGSTRNLLPSSTSTAHRTNSSKSLLWDLLRRSTGKW